MAWEWLGRSKQEVAEWTGFLEQGVRLDGRLEFPGTFRINGFAKGHLLSQHVLILGDEACVEGQINGNVVIIEGKCRAAPAADPTTRFTDPRNRRSVDTTSPPGVRVYGPRESTRSRHPPAARRTPA